MDLAWSLTILHLACSFTSHCTMSPFSCPVISFSSFSVQISEVTLGITAIKGASSY